MVGVINQRDVYAASWLLGVEKDSAREGGAERNVSWLCACRTKLYEIWIFFLSPPMLLLEPQDNSSSEHWNIAPWSEHL